MKMIHGLLIIVPLSLIALASCSLSGSFLTDPEQEALTTQSRAFQLQGEFNILLDAANTYASQPFCTEILIVGCAEPEIVIRASELAEATRPTLDAAQTASRAGLDTSVSLAAAARVGVAQLSAYLLTNSILKAGEVQ